MKTVKQWNAWQKNRYKSPSFKFTPPMPTEVGAKCSCGKPLYYDFGTCYGSGPVCRGVRCAACGRQGYIEEWMCAPKITLIK